MKKSVRGIVFYETDVARHGDGGRMEWIVLVVLSPCESRGKPYMVAR